MNAELTRRLHEGVVRHLATLLVLAAAGCLLWPGCRSGSGPATPASGPGAAASAAAKSPKELALGEFLKTMKLEGRPVLIEFGLVGCELSGQGLDHMIALQKANTVPGLAFVRVEGSQDTKAVDEYFKDKRPPFPVYRDTQSALAKSLSATAYPTFLLADKFGHIRYEGKYPQENLAQWGRTLVAEAKDPGSNVRPFGAREIDVEKLLANKLPDLKGDARPLGQYMTSGGLMLLFVDTSCPFCAIALKEMPMVSKALGDQKVGVIIVNNDDAKDRVRDFYAKNDPGAAVVYDVGTGTREQWNVHSVPIAVYISPAKKLVYRGEATWPNMGSAMETSLGLATGTIKFTAAGTGFG